MWIIGLSLVIAAACLWVSARRLAELPRPGSGDAERAAAELRRRPDRERVAHVLALLPPESETAAVLQAVLEAPTREHAIAEINLQLSEVSRRLKVGAEVPRAAARIAMASGTVLALVRVATGYAETAALVSAVTTFAIGLAAGLVCAQLGRLAGRRAVVYRETWNALGKRLGDVCQASASS